jgi:hypothetical protein
LADDEKVLPDNCELPERAEQTQGFVSAPFKVNIAANFDAVVDSGMPISGNR